MPKIIIDLNIDDDIKNGIEDKLKAKKLLINEYILELIEKDINSSILFNGFSYDFLTDKLYFESQEIVLTKIQKILFKFLLTNKNTLMSVEEIKTNVWKSRNMSLFTLRNMINSLRTKTYYELIKNVSNNGYMMVIEDN
jgi:DNA-binding response OmpR family regulator